MKNLLRLQLTLTRLPAGEHRLSNCCGSSGAKCFKVALLPRVSVGGASRVSGSKSGSVASRTSDTEVAVFRAVSTCRQPTVSPLYKSSDAV